MPIGDLIRLCPHETVVKGHMMIFIVLLTFAFMDLSLYKNY